MNIQNPKKEMVLEYNLDNVVNALNRVHELIKGCTDSTYNKTLKLFKLDFSELLSFGAQAIITLSSVGDNTKVEIEMVRKIGAYDKWFEIDNANKQILAILESLSILLDNPNYVTEEEETLSFVGDLTKEYQYLKNKISIDITLDEYKEKRLVNSFFDVANEYGIENLEIKYCEKKTTQTIKDKKDMELLSIVVGSSVVLIVVCSILYKLSYII